MIGSIYIIKNIINDKVYIGKTYRDLETRLIEHFSDSNKEQYNSRPLYKAFKKYGKENFLIEEIGKYEEEVLEEKEIYYIQKYNSYVGFENSNGYNATLGGDGKRYTQYSDKEIIEKYKELKTLIGTANYFNLSKDTVGLVLKNNKIPLANKKIVIAKKENFQKEFISITDAAQWLIDNNYTKGIKKGVRLNISAVLHGRSHSYLGFRWNEKVKMKDYK